VPSDSCAPLQTAAALRKEQQAARQHAQRQAKEQRRRQQVQREQQRKEEQDSLHQGAPGSQEAAEPDGEGFSHPQQLLDEHNQGQGGGSEEELDLLPEDVIAALSERPG